MQDGAASPSMRRLKILESNFKLEFESAATTESLRSTNELHDPRL
jgi:hypothetical protein